MRESRDEAGTLQMSIGRACADGTAGVGLGASKANSMLYFLTTHEHTYTFSNFIEYCGAAFARRVKVLSYSELPQYRFVSPGVYVFADLERVTGSLQRAMLGHVWDRLAESGNARLFNDPRKTLGRLALLETLFDRGLNPYNARRVGDVSRQLRPPVFLRLADDHHGPRTQTLTDPAKIQTAGKVLLLGCPRPSAVMEVEFCDTRDAQGVCRKYAAYLIDGKILPRHLMMSTQWVVKANDLSTPDFEREQQEYLATNPHERALLECFAAAHVTYGRIDYSMLNSRVVTWEINTNPNLMRALKYYTPADLESHAGLWSTLRASLEALEATAPGGPMIDLQWERLA